MIKRAGHILIIILLLFGTTGLTINRHYCGRNLIRTAFYSIPDHCCKENCPGCHNEKISFRITDQYESSRVHADFHAGFKTVLERNSLPVLLAFSNLPEACLKNDAPGGHLIKPCQPRPLFAGQSTPFLQVFLF